MITQYLKVSLTITYYGWDFIMGNDTLKEGTTTDPNRKAVICSQNLKSKIDKYVGKNNYFLSFSDFTLTACRFVVEQYHLQTLESVYRKMMKDLAGREVQSSMPSEPIDLIDFVRKEEEISGSKTLVTFPKGLLDDLTKMVSPNSKLTELIRYCLEYYLRVFESRKESDREVEDLMADAINEAYRNRIYRNGQRE